MFVTSVDDEGDDDDDDDPVNYFQPFNMTISWNWTNREDSWIDK